MLDIINAKDSNHLDQETIYSKTLTKNLLIDNASKAIAFHLIENIDNPFNKNFICIAGVGDNGVDAIKCHKILRENSINSKLYIVDNTKIKSSLIDGEDYYSKLDDVDFSSFDIIVDGIFGTGLNRSVVGDFADVINEISKFKMLFL